MSNASLSTLGRERRTLLIDAMVKERRILFGCTIGIAVAVIIWIVAFSTDHWFVISAETGIFINETQRYFVSSHSGLWRECRRGYTPKPGTFALRTNITTAVILNATKPLPQPPPILPEGLDLSKNFTAFRFCKYHDLFPNEVSMKSDPSIDEGILNYSRTEVSFAIISLIVMMMGLVFSVYTFMNPRYMFKRLAGGIHFISGSCVVVVIQVMLSSVEYEKTHLKYTFPIGASYYFGYSVYLAWIVMAINMGSGLMFMIYSRKKKGAKAINEEMGMVDEPTIIGR